MVLWTIMPPEMVFGTEEYIPDYEEICVEGKSILVEKLSPTQSRVVRLLSTCPDDYLQPELQPGSLLSWRLGY